MPNPTPTDPSDSDPETTKASLLAPLKKTEKEKAAELAATTVPKGATWPPVSADE